MTRCIPCAGSGKLMGSGFMQVNCNHCNGKGKIDEPENEIDYLHLKTTEGYKKAIDKIMATNDKITQEQATKIFEKEFNKIDKQDKQTKKDN